jgi:hypothetical protein
MIGTPRRGVVMCASAFGVFAVSNPAVLSLLFPMRHCDSKNLPG